MHKKIPKICTGCRVSEAKIYLYHSNEIAKARPHSVEWQTDTPVQKQWSMAYLICLFFQQKMHSGMNFKICGSLCYSSVTQISNVSLGITMYKR